MQNVRSAFQRLLTAGMGHHAEAETAQQQQAVPSRKALEPEMSLSRRVTEEHIARRMSADASVVHATPQREELDKRAGSSSDLGEVLSGSSCEVSSAECSPSGEPQLMTQNVEERLRAFLYAWGRKLVELQPKVLMSQHLVESGFFLFKCLRQLQLNACCEGALPLADLSNEVLLVHDLIACFWIALKALSIRTQVPNRTLVSKATGAQPELLGQRELAALIMLDWDVNTLLRFGGFVE